MNEYKNTGFTAGAANNWEGPKTELDEKAEKGGFALQEVMEGKSVKRQYPPEREGDNAAARELTEEKPKRGQNLTENDDNQAANEETGFTGGAANRWEGTKTKLDEKAEKGGFALQEVMEGKPVKRQYPPEREDE